MGKIFLVRHGEVEWNRENAYVGWTDIPLNQAGQMQAQKLADYLASTNISTIYASPLIRAFKTAETIASALNVLVHPVDQFKEINYGEWEGLSEDQIEESYTDIYHQWRKTPVNVKIPGGESFGEVAERAYPAFKKIAARHVDENIIIVAHKSVNRVILCCVLGIDINRYRCIGQENTCINLLESRKNGEIIVHTINDQCHLK